MALDVTPHWFVAHTRYFRQEMKVGEWLSGHGFENFVPTVQTRITRREQRGSRAGERPAVPNYVFVRVDKATACSFVSDYKLPMQYLTDCATHKMMVVPDKAMDDFRRVFDYSIEEGGLVDQPLELGERVRVIEGPLKDVEGFVAELQGRYYVVVDILGMIWAKARIPRAWLMKIEK